MVIALSYSRMSDYRQCPHKYKGKYIDKRPEFYGDKKSPHLIRGGNVHHALENYVVKKKAGENSIPVSSLLEVERTKPLIDKLMVSYDLHPEHQIAINDKFERVEWYSKEAWFRVIMDLIGFAHHLFIGDYKTGKISEYMGTLEIPGQLHLSSLIGMAIWPKFEEVHNAYIYVDHKKTDLLALNRTSHFKILKDRLIEEHLAINADTSFEPKKNEFCKWCDATNDFCFHSRKSVKNGFAF
jgi:hypothetical protein